MSGKVQVDYCPKERLRDRKADYAPARSCDHVFEAAARCVTAGIISAQRPENKTVRKLYGTTAEGAVLAEEASF